MLPVVKMPLLGIGACVCVHVYEVLASKQLLSMARCCVHIFQNLCCAYCIVSAVMLNTWFCAFLKKVEMKYRVFCSIRMSHTETVASNC